MDWRKWIRQTHRWFGIALTATVIACFVAVGAGVKPGNPAFFVFYVPLLPLGLLLLSGLYLFALPYGTRWRMARRTARQILPTK